MTTGRTSFSEGTTRARSKTLASSKPALPAPRWMLTLLSAMTRRLRSSRRNAPGPRPSRWRLPTETFAAQRARSAANARSAWPCMSSSLLITARSVRSVSITNVVRLLGNGPRRFTPNCFAMLRCGSESNGKPREFFWSKFFCRSTGSALIPARPAPSSANSAARSRK